MSAFLILLIALLADQLLKEPKRFHPLVGFGYLADKVEARLNSHQSIHKGRLAGLFALLLLLLPALLLSEGLVSLFGGWIAAPLLYLAIGQASLAEHAEAVREALLDNNLIKARQRVGWIVSRESDDLTENKVARAATESVLENGCDSTFGVIFWFLVAGVPGIIVYRLANTLDAMWGYRNDRFQHFGWAAANFDDLLNWVPARLTALSYALIGKTEAGLRCWKEQGGLCESPNGGPVMAAGAGALGVILGGDSHYHGKLKEKPLLGEGREATAESIREAVQLVKKTVLLWIVVTFILFNLNA
jgi:adenosylcobinamide-phosphate synthase